MFLARLLGKHPVVPDRNSLLRLPRQLKGTLGHFPLRGFSQTRGVTRVLLVTRVSWLA